VREWFQFPGENTLKIDAHHRDTLEAIVDDSMTLRKRRSSTLPRSQRAPAEKLRFGGPGCGPPSPTLRRADHGCAHTHRNHEVGRSERAVLNAVDVACPAAKFLVIVGPSAAGNQRLSCASCGHAPGRRIVRLGDTSLTTLPRKRGDVAMRVSSPMRSTAHDGGAELALPLSCGP
jgi:hypothetical protein